MNSGPKQRRTCLVGAGFISGVHAEALKQAGIPISAIVDPSRSAAEKFARRWGVQTIHASIDEALAADSFDRAHVLVPPDAHHNVALSLLGAGKSVLVEKPLCVRREECDSLIEAASSGGMLGVNQNFVFHPAFVRLRDAVRRRELGVPRFVNVIYNAPLRQLATRQFGHWMFREPRNILLEQAVHPLSQLIALCGDVDEVKALGEAPVEISPGVDFIQSFTANFRCRHFPASLRFAVGQSFPFWQVQVLCDDGVLVCDVLANRQWSYARTRWLDAIDGLLSGIRSARQIAGDSRKSSIDYVLSTAKLQPRSDAFYQSMLGSIRSFHQAADNRAAPLLDGAFGRTLVDVCDRIAQQVVPTTRPAARTSVRPSSGGADVAVLGGTGFIGTSVVRRLRDAGLTVSVMARSVANLPEIFYTDGVGIRRGDIRSSEDVARAVDGAKFVINLAHGGGGESWEEIRDAMLGGAENVAKACLKAQLSRLIHIGSIAGLYLGSQREKITGATPPDPRATDRGPYARAKAMCDTRLLDMQRNGGLPLCILRPGLVVGEGTSPFHSGVGFYNNEQHCIGWNHGLNPLPFVLVEDVAEAIFRSLHAQYVVGRCYNLVGGVRLSAREYTNELGKALERPLTFHASSPYKLYVEELGKWSVKRATGRKVPPPTLRDFLSRGLKAEFDCSDAERDLGWHPVSERDIFIGRAISIHAAR